MREKIVKSSILQMIGFAASQVAIYTYHPIGIAYYIAISCSRIIRWPVFPIMLAGMFLTMDILTVAKYALIMMAISIIFYLFESKKNRVNIFAGSLAGAGIMLIMELTDVLLEKGDMQDMLLAITTSVMAFSLAIIFYNIMNYFITGGSRKKDTYKKQKKKHFDMVNTYEERIGHISKALERMAKCVEDISDIKEHDNISNCKCKDCMSLMRQNKIYRNKLRESKKVIALQLYEISKVLKNFSYDTYDFKRVDEEQEEKLKTELRSIGVILRKIVILSNKKGIDEIIITMRARRGRNVAIKEVEKLVAKIFLKNVRLVNDVGRMVTSEEVTYRFKEEPNFFVLHGMAKKAKEEVVSGDSFSCIELNSGQTILSISDGMGTGVQAYKESELVVDLLEEFAYSGFEEEVALRMINSIFTLNGEESATATVDMGIIDMYSGMCDFVKLGAASTYVKRGDWLEVIKSTSMPIGGDESIDMESTTKKLYDGDFVIMMSDGLMEAVEKEEKEEALGEIIMGLKSLKPSEMAKEILRKALEVTGSKKEDDMTVLVTGIWDKFA